MFTTKNTCNTYNETMHYCFLFLERYCTTPHPHSYKAARVMSPVSLCCLLILCGSLSSPITEVVHDSFPWQYLTSFLFLLRGWNTNQLARVGGLWSCDAFSLVHKFNLVLLVLSCSLIGFLVHVTLSLVSHFERI